MRKLPHIYIALAALIVVLGFYLALVLVHGVNPKLMDGALILIGAIAALSRTDNEA